MQISRLKLSGFKSFVEPAELRIEPGLTGVVGPNGCGKSNLLEAIRWVMGENSPKSMRSGGMEDVIFAGTDTRPKRAFAEVVLHAHDDADEDLVVTRRIERGAGSAYRVNGRDVRAKDVALTFADAATGAHSPALVSQGKIAQVIAAKPAERRMMLEEAAGIAGLHVRRKDAESKLRSTEKNLERLEDLMAGLDAQMATLRRQAKQAERYTKLTEQIQHAEARVLFARWRDAAYAAKEARAAAQGAEDRVTLAQSAAAEAQKQQAEAAAALSEAREELADRRDDASAHGHRMAALSEKLEAAEQRLKDLDRQRTRLEEDRKDADRLTKDAAEALNRLERDVEASREVVATSDAQRPALSDRSEDAERASRTAELALAKATADHAGVEAEWRVAEAAIGQAQARLTRLEREAERIAATRASLADGADIEAQLVEAHEAADDAASEVARLRTRLEEEQSRKAELQTARDDASTALASAKAELAGIEREYTALVRDRDARAKREKGRAGRTAALDKVHISKGYERAIAAVLGRDAKAPLGLPPELSASWPDGRFWTGGAHGSSPAPVANSLLDQISDCPQELRPRLALVHVVDEDDGRTLGPGEWLVTKAGHLRRWDGFVARGEGSAEAARLEAANRLSELETQLPPLRGALDTASAQETRTREELSSLQTGLIAQERELAGAIEAERGALRKVDQAEAVRERNAARLEELAASSADLEEQLQSAKSEVAAAIEARSQLPSPDTGRASLEAARAKHEAAKSTVQAAMAQLAAHDQGLAVARERLAAQVAETSNWQARSGDATKRVADANSRLEEIEQEHAVTAAKPASLIAEIEQGDTIAKRLSEDLKKAQIQMEQSQDIIAQTDRALAAAQEALAVAREGRATLAARAENEEARRTEMARISGEKFQCPPPLLAQRFEFDEESVEPASTESAEMERLTAARERIGPVNLVAADELARIEEEHGTSASEQAELAEAVGRLRASIGNLNREGRERLRAAFEEVDGHFRVLFTRLFQGGAAHLALVDSDDPLEAGLEIYAQPPGKKLQSLSLLSGGEQALTATALIFGLFLTNPAPICVLDEVDAPLDDANVERFCDLLDSMVETTKTRYLIVTHNAVTMSRMHRLFGVTMAEQGVSRLVSVDLGEAALIAAE